VCLICSSKGPNQQSSPSQIGSKQIPHHSAMSASVEPTSMGAGLRERQVTKTSSSRSDTKSTIGGSNPQVDGHAEKEKKTYGRTPDGTGEEDSFFEKES
jgi:hypothetical protein